ncbi:MAG: glycosyltransferase family 32 protein [Lacipirellulaceae bacterium]
MPPIPPILHQTSRTADPPKRWRHTIEATRRLHADWRYELWTDERMGPYVDEHHPRLAPVFHGFERGIMRADVIRYVALHDMGGLYCDTDYEFLRPFAFGEARLVFSMEFDRSFGDACDQLANYVIASAPRHPFWRDVLDELIANPPRTSTYDEVCGATGPGLLSRVYFANRQRYEGVLVTNRPVLSPYRLRGRNERQLLLNSGVTYGFHHACGSWKERWTALYLRRRAAKLLGCGPGRRVPSAA